MESTPGVRDNPTDQRYELPVGDDMAVVTYDVEDGVVAFIHTFVPESLRGRGLATQVVKAALEGARAKGLKVDPQCPTVAAYVKAHPETQDLLTDEARAALGL